MLRKLSPHLLPLIVIFLLALWLNVACQTASDSLATPAVATPAVATPAAPPAADPVGDAAQPESEPTAVPEPTPSPTPIPLPETVSFARQSDTAVAATDSPIQTENGIEVQLGATAVETTTAVTLSQFSIDPAWQAALEQTYTLETPFVALTAAGLNDSTGHALLRLPAAAPNARLVAVIDGRYLAVLDVVPQNGYLETAVRIGPASTEAVAPVGSLTPGGSLHFVVLSPRSASQGKPTGTARLASDPHNCGLEIDLYQGVVGICRQNSAGTVQVNYHPGISGMSDSLGDQLAEAVATAMARYEQLGFTAAKLTAAAPMRIVVNSASGEPKYRSTNGIIYLPVDAAKGMISGADLAAIHEMAHWIQDEEYNMAWAYWSGSKTWWLEVAAENMVMLHTPAYLAENLTTYGTISTADNRLALQQSLYQWPGDFYVQAQLLKVNMCADTAVCPLSEKSFVEAINAGLYPFDGADAQAKISANLDSYANYLLGAPPIYGNTTIPLSGPVATGEGYGEYIQISQKHNTSYNITLSGYPPQMQKNSNRQGEGVDIAATLQKDGVYPLRVMSGKDGRSPGLPVMLAVQPGAPFWYRLGDDPPRYHDGGSELLLGPVHMTLGVPHLRLVALSKTGDQQFKARLQLIDLQGAWLLNPKELVSGSITCLREDGKPDEKVDPTALPTLLTYVSAMGDFKPESSGLSYTWDWNMKRVDDQFAPYAGSVLLFNGAATLAPENVQAQLRFEWVKQETESTYPWQRWALGAGLAVPVLLLGAIGSRKRPYLGLGGVMLALLLLAGCVGLGFDLWGTVAANLSLTKAEYIGGEGMPLFDVADDPSAVDVQPVWKLFGTADYDIDFWLESEATTTDSAGNEVTQSNFTHCTGTPRYNVELWIFRDIALNSE